jgi:glycosyltransferase involved in cell wall biosynthesis
VLPYPAGGGTLATVRRVRRVLRDERPDLLLTYNWGAIEAVLAARFGGPPVLHHEDGFRPDEAVAQKGRRVLFRRLVLRGARGVVVPSSGLLELATGSWRVPRERAHWIPNGVRVDDFPAADGNPELRARLGVPADALLVGSVGHLRPEKNPARLVAALAHAPASTHLLFVGDGDERDRVLAVARELGAEERVHLAGHLTDPRPYYRAFDVFALSSDTEQLPVAMLEAMSSALPVVATDVGDVRRTLPIDQRSLVVPLAGDDTAAALGRALAELAGDPDRRARLGALNRDQAIGKYDFDEMVRAYRQRYRDALA